MRWYEQLSLGRKILAGFLTIACLAGVSGLMQAGSIWNVGKRGELMYTANLVPISDLTEVVRGYQASLYLLRDIVIDQSPQEQTEHLDKLKQSEAQVTKGLNGYFAANRSAEAIALQKSIAEDLNLYQYFRDKIVELAATGRRDEAVNLMRTQASDVTERLDANLAKVVAINKAQAGKRYTENLAVARGALLASIASLCLGVAAALAIGYFLSRSITAPLARIAEKVAAIAAGDLTTRIGGSRSGRSANELDLLSASVDQMADTLHQVVARISSESHNLSAASSNLNNASGTMAKRSELSAQEINAVTSSSSEMNQTASEIARNCLTASDNVGQADRAAAQGRTIMGETIALMRGIGEHACNTSRLISSLGEHSLQISRISETISDIADQTNLLALNAAIEAARAGDQGRGFAVVADEVRALASHTTAATKEISGMIKAIQGDTRQAIAAMDQGVSEANLGIGKAEGAGAALEAITGRIRLISDQVSHIATAAEEQSCSVEGITANLRQVTGLIQESAAGTQEFSAEAARLYLMAQDLRQIVNGFAIEPPPAAASEVAGTAGAARSELKLLACAA